MCIHLSERERVMEWERERERTSMNDKRTKSKATEKKDAYTCREINHHANTKQWQLDTYMFIYCFDLAAAYFSTTNKHVHMYLYMSWIPSSLRATIRLLCQWWEVLLSPFRNLYFIRPPNRKLVVGNRSVDICW